MIRLALAYGLLFFGSPGLVWAEGSFVAAVVGLALWSDAVRHRPRRPRLAEWFWGSCYGAALMGWAALVWWPTLLWIGAGFGLYLLGAGYLVRRLEARLPLPLATALAWVGIESLRTALPTPLGLSWIRTGHHALDLPWLAGSVRVFGVAGLSFVAASLGGALAGLVRARGSMGSGSVGSVAGRVGLVSALVPLALAVAGSVFTAPPPHRSGPRVMLVQPAFEQERKRFGDPRENHLASLELTAQGLAEARAAGEPVPDLVVWGESMIGMPLREDTLLAALAAGWRLPEDKRYLADAGWATLEEELIGLPLFGRRDPAGPRDARAILPEGTVFAAGAETYGVEGEGAEAELAHYNAVVLWDAAGRRGPGSPKQFLVPGAETMLGLERLDWVARINVALGNYVPDFRAGRRTGLFAFETRSGAVHQLGASVCFDNAYLEPYLQPLANGDALDFHLVASNEAWYRRWWEAPQMIAFSRAIALASGRSVVRATNSGASAVVGPDGNVLARLEVGGEDRMVRGTLRADVPVPAPGAGIPPFARWSRAWTVFWLLLPALACALPVRWRNRGPAAG